ncbi:MAG: hypothetical protein ACTIDY_15805 [Halomonadaceae bacterium]
MVTVNYLLGLLGFLDGYANRPIKLGLLNIILALRWINTT